MGGRWVFPWTEHIKLDIGLGPSLFFRESWTKRFEDLVSDEEGFWIESDSFLPGYQHKWLIGGNVELLYEFTPNLHAFWGVVPAVVIVFVNSLGLKTYLYSEDKIHLEQEKKFKLVQKFSENYDKIISNIENNLAKIEYLALYTLLKTVIRVGNYDYYLKNSHKGLTTLLKRDISVEGEKILFDFIGKDGVPHQIKKEFSEEYIVKLKKILSTRKKDEFVFTGLKGKPLHSEDFSSIFFNITQEHFYPHIIRSHHADSKCLDFLEGKIEIQNTEKLFFQIAKDLGHKKYNKKKEQWEISPNITIKNYIYPEYVKKIRAGERL